MADKLSEWDQRAIDQFFEEGGEVTKVPRGASGLVDSDYSWRAQNAAAASNVNKGQMSKSAIRKEAQSLRMKKYWARQRALKARGKG